MATHRWDSEGKGQRTLQARSGAPNPVYLGSPQARELLETLPMVLLLLVLCGLDWALYSIFDTIRRHSFLQYSFRSEPGSRHGPSVRPLLQSLSPLSLRSLLLPSPTLVLPETLFLSTLTRQSQTGGEG